MTELRAEDDPSTNRKPKGLDSHTKGSTVPVEMQTTVRVRKDLAAKLKKIAAVEEMTVFDLVNEIVSERISRYESALGKSVNEMGPRARDF